MVLSVVGGYLMQFSTRTKPKIDLFYPQKICIGIVSISLGTSSCPSGNFKQYESAKFGGRSMRVVQEKKLKEQPLTLVHTLWQHPRQYPNAPNNVGRCLLTMFRAFHRSVLPPQTECIINHKCATFFESSSCCNWPIWEFLFAYQVSSASH